MSTLQVQAELLERRSALDAKCVDLALQFVQNLATAEDLFARAVNRASAILVTGLLETDFGSGAESSRRRAALLAIGKMASVLSAEVGEHANELQTVAAAELTELSAAAAQRTLLLASRRAGRQRDERAALEALGQAKHHRQEMTAAAAAAAAAAAGGPRLGWGCLKTLRQRRARCLWSLARAAGSYRSPWTASPRPCG